MQTTRTWEQYLLHESPRQMRNLANMREQFRFAMNEHARHNYLLAHRSIIADCKWRRALAMSLQSPIAGQP